MGRSTRDHELLLLRGDRPPPALDGRGDRVPARHRTRRARRRGPGATARPSSWPWPASTCSPGRRSCSGPLGFAFAFANAALFAGYIVLAHRVARHPSIAGIDGLALAMLIAAVVVTPLAGWQAAPALSQPVAVLAGIGVGVSSSVIPYVTDQLAMARLPRATYSLMVSLLPAIATVIGLVVLAQVPDADRCGRHRVRDRRGRAAPRVRWDRACFTAEAAGV